MNYSVIINTYNKDKRLVFNAISSAANQKIKPTTIQLLDQNEISLKVPSDFSSIISHIKINSKSLSLARNSNTANSEWLVFLDDDGFLKPNYSEVLLQLIESHPNTHIFAGVIKTPCGRFYSSRQKVGGDLNKFWNSKLLMGGNFVIKKEIFWSLGGLDIDFGIGSTWGSSEETDLTWRANSQNVPMFFSNDLQIEHPEPHKEKLIPAIKKSYSYGVGKGALVAKWLVKERKLIVTIELLEMTFVPIFKIVFSLLKLNLKNLLTASSSLIGRYCGIVKFLLHG